MTNASESAPPSPAPTSQPAPKRFQCRHILTSGRRCRSASLRGEQFCYYHHTTRRPAPRHRGVHPEHAIFELPAIDDRAGVQFALAQVLARVATDQLDPSAPAAILLRPLHLASWNLLANPAPPAYPHRQPRLPPLPPETPPAPPPPITPTIQTTSSKSSSATPTSAPSRPSPSSPRPRPRSRRRSRRRRPPPQPRQPPRRPLPSQPHPHPRPHPTCGCPILGRRSHRRTGWGREWSRRNH